MTNQDFIHPLSKINFNSKQSFALAIEASAGTGKTWTIERLFVKSLIENPQLSVKDVLVVTFTNAAAKELKARILLQIKESINLLIRRKNAALEISEDPFIRDFIFTRDLEHLQIDVTILSRAVQLFDQASIFTIHGFCNQVLNDFPVECNVTLPFETEVNNKELLQTLVHQFYREQIIHNSLFSANLNHVITQVEKLFKSDYKTTIIEKIINKLPPDLLQLDKHKLKLKHHNLQALEMDIFNQVEIDKATGLAVLLGNVAEFILKQYTEYRRLHNKITFDELVQLVANGVTGSPSFATSLFTKYPVAFIDEFQDTDNLQWTIFSTIYDLKTDKPRGNVVIVGDPKQAIYRFRGADIDTYLSAVNNDIKKNNIGNKKSLIENRRSHPQIMNFINQLFNLDNQQGNSEFMGTGIDYQQIAAKVDEQKLVKPPSALELTKMTNALKVCDLFYDDRVHLVALPREILDDDARENWLLNALTFEILALLKVEPELKGKIAILVAKNRQASELVKFMRKFGIKASELKLCNIFTTSTANDLWKIIDSIMDLSNSTKFNLAISSKLFNFELNKLVNREAYQSEFEALYQQFYSYHQVFLNKGIISLIYQLVADVAQNKQLISNRELANLFQLGELLHKQSKISLNSYELLHWFKNKLNTADQQLENELDGDNEELIRLDNDDDQIVITTQHKSKGLEFEILFCPYFKNDEKVGGIKQGYQLPFFASYQQNGSSVSELIRDKDLAQKIVERDNCEIHRLNYVALTRAKSRLYIYLEPSKLKKDGKYNKQNSKPNKIDELFGFNYDNPLDESHKLFNYASFFGDATNAIKPDAMLLLNGVVAYQRLIREIDLNKLSLIAEPANKLEHSQVVAKVVDGMKFTRSYLRQSYSGLASLAIANEKEHYSADDVNNSSPSLAEYRYEILNGKLESTNHERISGAKFGLLFHELCENYPLTETKITKVLQNNNLKPDNLDMYHEMINEAFNTPLTANDVTLAQIHLEQQYQAEFEFNIQIQSQVDMADKIAAIIKNTYGDNHPYTQASLSLAIIEPGFLNGFIDLLFEHEGKFWVLDYKTNTLDNYNISATDEQSNPLIASMAHHHYYLQYLLYLVAVKRHLELVYNLTDASSLIGGSIYFYVRGVYVMDEAKRGGVIVDDKCIMVVKQIDDLLKGN